MPIDLPPNLQNTVTPIVRSAEQMPTGTGGHTEKKGKSEASDGVNARNADKNSSSKHGHTTTVAEVTKTDVLAEASRVAGLAVSKGRRFDYSRAGVRGWLVRDVEDRPYQSGDLHGDRTGDDWKDFHNKLGQIWLGENGTLFRADEAYGASAEIGTFDNSSFREAINEDLIGVGNVGYGQLMTELRRL
ncbi:hypothetical protein ACPW96_23270, partial [Micromonospora sp. DT81.3]|uniref:hypothetical protein n=1 Tax=Micromonospora sp. DT81.3 TaxID=3416523 RepID=UPI003CEE66AD